MRKHKESDSSILDNFADDIAADIAAETLAARLGKTRTISNHKTRRIMMIYKVKEILTNRMKTNDDFLGGYG